jgi:hypothetical protein
MTDAQCRWLRAVVAAVAFVLAIVAATAGARAASLSFVPEPSAVGLGQGTMLTVRLGFSGSEYFGSPAPLTGLKFTLPVGIRFSSSGFATCEADTPGKLDVDGCPAGSAAGEASVSIVLVVFAGARIEEDAETKAFFLPSGGLEFVVLAQGPVPLEMALPGTLVKNVLTLRPALVASRSGESYVSFKLLTLNLGIARAVQGMSVYSLQMPEECPQGKFTWSAEADLATALDPGLQQPLPVTADTACPEHSGNESSLPGTEGAIVAPSNKRCVSRRDFIIHIQQLNGLTYRSASVYVDGKRVDVTKGARFRARVDLRSLPKGRYTVRIAVTTTSGRQISGTRAYHTCAPKPIPYGRPRL